jgi:ubiquinol-cytochrome c reductase cytochrome c subunit
MRAAIRCAAILSLIASITPATAAGDVDKGRIAFSKNGCWQCHGYQGQGSIMTSNGKSLAPDPLAWDSFVAFVRMSNTGMPPYTEKVLPNDALEDIYAYLVSIPRAREFKSIPLLDLP